MINRVLAILWPHITGPGARMGLDIAKSIVGPMLKSVSGVPALSRNSMVLVPWVGRIACILLCDWA